MNNHSIETAYAVEQDKDRRNTRRKHQFHWRRSWRRWMDKRVPKSRSIVLNQRNVFIFPTVAGFVYLGFLLLLLVAAINFQNSPIYALTFLLFGLFIVSILHTFSNLSALKISAAHIDSTFAGNEASIHIILQHHGKRAYHGLRIAWPANSVVHVDLDHTKEVWIALPYRTFRRGLCDPGRLKVETRFPLGLMRAWTWIDLDLQVLSYPRPLYSDVQNHSAQVSNETGQFEKAGDEDFFGLRSYAAGDAIKSIAWKNYAKTQSLNTKQFVDTLDQRVWLDWSALSELNDEQKLSMLCHQAIEFERGHREYGLNLPTVKIQPGRGVEHLNKVLKTLALF